MNNDQDHTVMFKLLLAWIGTAVGGVSMSTLVLGATLVFTLLQIYVMVRKLRREIRLEKLEAKLRQPEVKP